MLSIQEEITRDVMTKGASKHNRQWKDIKASSAGWWKVTQRSFDILFLLPSHSLERKCCWTCSLAFSMHWNSEGSESRFVWPLKRHSSATFGNTLLRPPPAWLARLSHPLVLSFGHQSLRVWKGQTPDDQKRLILHQNLPQETGSVEDFTFFKAVVILLTAPFEGLSLLYLERQGSLPDLERRWSVKASLPF